MIQWRGQPMPGYYRNAPQQPCQPVVWARHLVGSTANFLTQHSAAHRDFGRSCSRRYHSPCCAAQPSVPTGWSRRSRANHANSVGGLLDNFGVDVCFCATGGLFEASFDGAPLFARPGLFAGPALLVLLSGSGGGVITGLPATSLASGRCVAASPPDTAFSVSFFAPRMPSPVRAPGALSSPAARSHAAARSTAGDLSFDSRSLEFFTPSDDTTSPRKRYPTITT